MAKPKKSGGWQRGEPRFDDAESGANKAGPEEENLMTMIEAQKQIKEQICCLLGQPLTGENVIVEGKDGTITLSYLMEDKKRELDEEKQKELVELFQKYNRLAVFIKTIARVRTKHDKDN